MKQTIRGLMALGLLAGSITASAVEIYYQEGFTANIYRFDSVAGTNTLLGTTGGPADSFGMAFASNGTLYAHDRGTASLYTISTTTGAATLVGATGVAAEDLTINLAGTTGYITSGSGELFAVSLATGAATSLGSLGIQMDGLTTAPVAVTFNGTGYAAGSIFGVDSGSIYAINIGAVTATFIGSVTGADETFDFGPGGTLYGHGDDGLFYTIATDPLGSAVLGASTPNIVFGMAVQAGGQVVPEPATLALLGLGLIAAGFARRRKLG